MRWAEHEEWLGEAEVDTNVIQALIALTSKRMAMRTLLRFPFSPIISLTPATVASTIGPVMLTRSVTSCNCPFGGNCSHGHRMPQEHALIHVRGGRPPMALQIWRGALYELQSHEAELRRQ
jgi:hypothetical protein